MKKRGMTLTELLVTIAVITLLMFVLLPILKRLKHQRIRAACKNNFRHIGLAMLIYSNDYADELPRAADANSEWRPAMNWQAETRAEAYGLDDGPGGATISASLYLLIKCKSFSQTASARPDPNLFVCPADTGATPFQFAASGDTDLTDLWDFGPDSSQHVSYAYHMPYSQYPLTCAGDPGFAVAADRNPWISTPAYIAGPPGDLTAFNPAGSNQARKKANSLVHLRDGQNVVYLDGHVAFEATPTCGLRSDNIYTSHNGDDIERGIPPAFESRPADANDSLLVHDPPRGLEQ